MSLIILVWGEPKYCEGKCGGAQIGRGLVRNIEVPKEVQEGEEDRILWLVMCGRKSDISGIGYCLFAWAEALASGSW